MNIRFVSAADREWIGELWSRLERRFGSTDIMCSWQWTETWIHHYGDQVHYCFAIGELDAEPVGLALVTCLIPLPIRTRTGWLDFRGIVHIGTAGEARGHSVDVEYNRLLAAPSRRDEFASGLLAAIRHKLRPIAIVLDGFVAEAIAAMSSVHQDLLVTDLPCPTFDLDRVRNEKKDVLSSLGSGVRARIRRSNRGFGELQGEWASTPAQALDIFEEMITLHQVRWEREGRRGAFASPRFAGFHRAFISRSMGSTGDASKVMLFRLRHHNSTIGCLYGFLENGMVQFYQSGFVEVDDNHLKPGLSTHAACMQQCLERGLQTYNFLAGEARYKRELANTEYMLKSAIIYRYARMATVVATVRRLGVIDRARAVKRWSEQAGVARGHDRDPTHTTIDQTS